MNLSLKSILPLSIFLLSLCLLDQIASIRGTGGSERNAVYNFYASWRQKPKAKIAIFGSSTSKDWLPEKFLADLLGTEERNILDAHINGCHQDCSWAQFRGLRRRNVKYDAVFYGQNQFQWCEYDHSKRALQHSMMLPLQDYRRAMALYFESDHFLKRTARLLGMMISDAYGDTNVARRSFVKQVLHKRPYVDGDHWIHQDKDPLKASQFCDYNPESIAYKLAVAEALLTDFEEVTDRIFWIMLPDRNLSELEQRADYALGWKRHWEQQKALASRHPKVTLIDLVSDGVSGAEDFRDDIHLTEEAMPRQRALFQKRLQEVLKREPIEFTVSE